MTQKRYHPPARISEHPMVKDAFKVMGAMLIATKGKDLEADFALADEDGLLHQFHVEVTEVQTNET
jgi:hypothetical protein